LYRLTELQPDQFSQISSLLAALPQTVLPSAICQRHNPGRVFVDNPLSPQRALLWTSVGYFFLCGEPIHDPATSQALSACLTETMIPASQERGSILITSPGWETMIDRLLPGRNLIRIFRRPFCLNSQAFASLTLPPLPPGFNLVPMDAGLARGSILAATWGSAEAFARRGFGYALLHDGEIASSCAAVFASHNAVEIDIQTAEPYRRRGLALITAAAFLNECNRRGLRPNWECFWDNLPSAALAARLGFQPLPDFPVTYWEEPPG